MIEGFEYKGQWWLPNEPAKAVSGVLKYTHSDGAVLELMGSFEDSGEMHKMLRPMVILGTSLNGKDISLHGCFLIQAWKSYPGFSTSSYFANMVFVGAHFHKTEDIRFRSMNVRFSHLDEWANMSGFKIDQFKEEDVVIRYRRPDDIRVAVGGDFTIAITTRATFPTLTLVQKKARSVDN